MTVPPAELHRRLHEGAEARGDLRVAPRHAHPVPAAVVSPAGGPRRLPADLTAVRTVTGRQLKAILGAAALALVALLGAPVATLTLFVAIATVFYVAAFTYRVTAFWDALRSPAVITVSDDAARAVADADLPHYTILVPAYGEPAVIGLLIRALDHLEYPRDRLDVKVLLEEDDAETIAAARAVGRRPWVEIVVVPYSEPRTKPKACNVGLATARGDLVTVYDAEDRPDPLQLRRAAAAFRTVGPEIACLQARLVYHNPDQNMITRWFATEYAMWFSQLLPGLVQRDAPLPLGGTSNHFRRPILDAVGAWDPHNVTEDADLGIRLHRAGFRTRVLDSVTYEEANSDFVNWIKQRSRWYKGYLQTWLVHLRRPRELYRELGFRGFVGFNLFVGGTPLLALINPIFWALTALWFIGRPAVIAELFPAWLYYASVFCLVGGNLTFMYTWIVGGRAAGSATLTAYGLLSPIYWAMMSIAAIKAAVQLVTAPSFWEKTVHGLDHPAAPDRDRVAA